MPCRSHYLATLRSIGIVVVAWALAACSSSTSTKIPLGGDCQGLDSICASGECLTVDTGTTICTATCTSNANCPSSMVCNAVPGHGSVCLPLGLAGLCKTADDCAAGFLCDTDSNHCYIPVARTLCSPCTSSKQCPMNGVCRGPNGEEYCTTPCDMNGGCPAGYTCGTIPESSVKQCLPDNKAQSCVPPRGLCEPCSNDAQCGDPTEFCVRNLASNERFCGTACKTSSDCPSNFTCTDLSGVGSGPNQCVPNSGTCKGYCDSTDPMKVATECGFNETCDMTKHQCQQAMDGSICAGCTNNDECASHKPDAQCLVNDCTDCPFKGETFCSSPCTPGGSDCPAGFQCAMVSQTAGVAFCLPISGTCHGGAAPLGDDCTGVGADVCAGGVCLALGPTSMCSQDCKADSDCGRSDFHCCARSGMSDNQFDCSATIGTAGGVCVPRGGAIGSDCSPGQPPCFQGVCLDLGTARVCTAECPMGNECPMGFTCRNGESPNGDGTNQSIPVCFPNGGGSTGADCTFGPAACQSGLCLKRTTSNICTVECSAMMPCPSGYTCQNTNLTIPTPTEKNLNVCVPAPRPTK